MLAFRAFLLTHRRLAALVLLCALLMRVILPSGYMIAPAANGSITVQVCSGMAGETQSVTIPFDRKAPPKAVIESKGICAFAGDHHALGGVDPLLLAAAIAFILLLGFAPIHAPRLSSGDRLRPPLRGPPLFS